MFVFSFFFSFSWAQPWCPFLPPLQASRGGNNPTPHPSSLFVYISPRGGNNPTPLPPFSYIFPLGVETTRLPSLSSPFIHYHPFLAFPSFLTRAWPWRPRTSGLRPRVGGWCIAQTRPCHCACSWCLPYARRTRGRPERGTQSPRQWSCARRWWSVGMFVNRLRECECALCVRCAERGTQRSDSRSQDVRAQ